MSKERGVVIHSRSLAKNAGTKSQCAGPGEPQYPFLLGTGAHRILGEYASVLYNNQVPVPMRPVLNGPTWVKVRERNPEIVYKLEGDIAQAANRAVRRMRRFVGVQGNYSRVMLERQMSPSNTHEEHVKRLSVLLSEGIVEQWQIAHFMRTGVLPQKENAHSISFEQMLDILEHPETNKSSLKLPAINALVHAFSYCLYKLPHHDVIFSRTARADMLVFTCDDKDQTMIDLIKDFSAIKKPLMTAALGTDRLTIAKIWKALNDGKITPTLVEYKLATDSDNPNLHNFESALVLDTLHTILAILQIGAVVDPQIRRRNMLRIVMQKPKYLRKFLDDKALKKFQVMGVSIHIPWNNIQHVINHIEDVKIEANGQVSLEGNVVRTIAGPTTNTYFIDWKDLLLQFGNKIEADAQYADFLEMLSQLFADVEPATDTVVVEDEVRYTPLSEPAWLIEDD